MRGITAAGVRWVQAYERDRGLSSSFCCDLNHERATKQSARAKGFACPSAEPPRTLEGLEQTSGEMVTWPTNDEMGWVAKNENKER